jgi:hypothetical protein
MGLLLLPGDVRHRVPFFAFSVREKSEVSN